MNAAARRRQPNRPVVGTARAVETFAIARRVHADEALEIGLVSRLHADALACALEIASRSS
jgi:enoyl-CoA hydratase/carnithine racemase